MTDNWDDSEDEWDASDDELDARLGLNKLSTNDAAFDEEEDLAVKEKSLAEKANLSDLKKKGTALQAKKREEQERAEEEELARKTMEMEAEMEANMTPEELKALKQKQVEDADHALTDDLFGGVDSGPSVKVAAADDTVVLVDLKDHLKHARKVSTAIKKHGKIHLASAFLKETIDQLKDLLDDDAITDIIKTCNVIKNEKVIASKRKVKGQAQKAKKDKKAEEKAKKLQQELYGENDQYDEYDNIGADYEDAFF
jgi:translation initiation factor 3 subunit J